MSDSGDRLDKNLQIAALNQKIETIQLQLSGSQKRASQLTAEVQSLQSAVSERDAQITKLRAENERTKAALDAVGKEMRGIRSEQTQQLAKTRPATADQTVKEQLDLAIKEARAAREDIRKLSEASTAVLNGEDDAVERLRRVVLEVGDPRYRILNMVLEKRSVKLDEIAAALVADTARALKLVEGLQDAGEVEIRDGSTVIPAEKYRVVRIPKDEWQKAAPADIFDQLAVIVGKTEGHENVAEALRVAVEILEQKIARGGALIFQMRRAVNTWKTTPGNVEELQYTIKEWKARAAALG